MHRKRLHYYMCVQSNGKLLPYAPGFFLNFSIVSIRSILEFKFASRIIAQMERLAVCGLALLAFLKGTTTKTTRN